jgi:rhodanese-related sulfurtransferase
MAIAIEILSQLEPLRRLSPERLKEMAGLCFAEHVSKDIDPFRMNVVQAAQSLYLLRGDLAVNLENGRSEVLQGGSEQARYPVGHSIQLKNTVALTDIDIVRVDTDLLDIMMTWDQLADYEQSAAEAEPAAPIKPAPNAGNWMKHTGVFSAGNLQSGIFSRLPPANIDEMFRRMSSIPAHAGQTIINQGAEGDYYYLIESGTAHVTRETTPGQPPLLLAELKAGDAFGEEALVSDNKRNATVTMITSGVLMRLSKRDFAELLKHPLVQTVSMAAAETMVKRGALWIDVRFPSEYNHHHLPDAINTPLHDIREALKNLDRHREYITYCQSGRRSSAAAFIMAQHGFDVRVLEDLPKSQLD